MEGKKAKKKKSIEKRIKLIEDRLYINQNLEGTDSPILNFFGTLIIWWLPFLSLMVVSLYRIFRLLFFMSRREQAKRKWAYANGEFNFLKYIFGGDLKD